MVRDTELDTLLDLNGMIAEQSDEGHWIKIEAISVEPSEYRPHGVKYSLTLHDKYGARILGYDNAHAPDRPHGFRYVGQRYPYDHIHRHQSKKAEPYEFQSAVDLLADFFIDVDCFLRNYK